MAHQRALDTAEAPQGGIERLSLSQKTRVGHELAPGPTAKATVEVTQGVKAGATAGLAARVNLGVVLKIDNQGPLMDLCLGGG